MLEIFLSQWNTEYIFRLLFTMLLCGFIGLEREYKGETAGLRTHILIGIGACTAMIIGDYYLGANPNSSGDSLRIAGEVMSGIGFLGAGAIMKMGIDTKGLATAASVWATAAIGLLVGSGNYTISLIAAGLILFTFIVITSFEKSFTPSSRSCKIKIYFSDTKNLSDTVNKLFSENNIYIEKQIVEYSQENNKLEYIAKIPKKINISDVKKIIQSKFPNNTGYYIEEIGIISH